MSVSFELSSEQIALREMTRKFARKELRPMAREIDEKDEFPAELWEKCPSLPICIQGSLFLKNMGETIKGYCRLPLLWKSLWPKENALWPGL